MSGNLDKDENLDFEWRHKPLYPISDESKPSWLEPGLELNNFQLDSARLVTFSIQLGNFSIKARKSAKFFTVRIFSWLVYEKK